MFVTYRDRAFGAYKSGFRLVFAVLIVMCFCTVYFKTWAHENSDAEGLVAVQLTAENIHHFRVGGDDAVGGIGDWFIGNGTVCAVISDISHEDELSATGGVLTDITRCDKAGDFFLTQRDFINGADNSVRALAISAQLDEGRASIIIDGEAEGVKTQTIYSVDTQFVDRLSVEKHIEIVGEQKTISHLFPIVLNSSSMRSFVSSPNDPKSSTGTKTVDFTNADPADIANFSFPGNLIVAESLAARGDQSISVGWRMNDATLTRRNGDTEALSFFSVADHTAFGFIIFPEAFWIEPSAGLGWLQLVQAPFLEAVAGEKITLREDYVVAENGVAGVLNHYHMAAPLLTGQIHDHTARIILDHVSGEPFSSAYPDKDGLFQIRAPEGDYKLTIEAAGERTSVREIEIKADDMDLGVIEIGVPSRIMLPEGQALRLTILGKNADGKLNRDDRYVVHLAGTEDDPKELIVPHGSYRIFASKGITHTLSQVDVTVGNDEAVSLEIAPPVPAFELTGMVSADMHVHSAVSLDSVVTPENRVRSYVAEGMDILVATEHDNLFDYQPLIKEMGLSHVIAGVIGTEITSEVSSERTPYTIGHGAAFPVAIKPDEYRRGVTPHEGRRWREVIADIKQENAEALLQLNHARSAMRHGATLEELKANIGRDVQGHFLDHMGVLQRTYDPTLPIDHPHNVGIFERDPETGISDMSFDAIEVYNGSDIGTYEALRRDWFSLLKQGLRITGSANSDTHGLSNVAIPRSYIPYEAYDSDALDLGKFRQALKENRLTGTSGPIPIVTIEGKGVGDTVSLGGRSSIMVDVKLKKADWVPADTLEIFVNGNSYAVHSVDGRDSVSVPVDITRDSFITVEVRGKATAEYQVIYPGFTPLAYINPIYLDFDGDGTWTPPMLQ